MRELGFLGVCALFAGVTALTWGLVVSIFHPMAGAYVGVLIFLLGFFVLVNNDKDRLVGNGSMFADVSNNTQWLYSPEDPGTKVLVYRGFWGRLMKPKDFATMEETRQYLALLSGLQRRRFDD